MTESALNQALVPGAKPSDVTRVHTQLRNDILRGALEPGQTVSQLCLAEHLNAGRTPLREALRLLEREGLVITEPNRPVRIAPLTSQDFESIYVMRVALAAAAAAATVPTLTVADIAELEGSFAQMSLFQKAGDVAGFRGPHRAFDRKLVAGAGERVVAELDQLADHSERYRVRFAKTVKWDELLLGEHRAILDAAAERDSALVVQRITEHHARIAAFTLSALNDSYEPLRLYPVLESLASSAPEAYREGAARWRSLAN